MKRIKGGETVKAYATTMSIYPNGDRVIRKCPMSYTHIAGDTGITHELENFEWPEIPDPTPRLKETEKGWELVIDGEIRAHIGQDGQVSFVCGSFKV